MPQNEYEALIEDETGTGNEYGKLIQEQSAGTVGQVQSSMFVAAKGPDPDRQAKILALSKKSNVPAEVVARNYDDVYSKTELAQNDYEKLIDESPGVSKFISDPQNATLAKDEIPKLQNVENTTKEYGLMDTMFNAIEKGFADLDSSIAKLPALGYQLGEASIKYLQGKGADQFEAAPDALVNNPLVQYFDTISQEKQQQIPELSQSVMDSLKAGNFASAARIASVQVVASAPQQVALLAAMASGLGEAGLAITGATTAASANFENQAAGIDPTTGVVNAMVKGTIESAFESLGTFGIFKHWEGAIAKSFGKASAREFTVNAMKTLLYSAAGEGNEEAWTSVAQDMTDYITGVNPDALKGIGQRALDAGIVGGISGVAMTSPGAVLSGVKKGKDLRQATLARDFYTKLGESIDDTKLKDRSPEHMGMLINNMVEGSHVENVYISPDAFETYYQTKDITPAQAAQELGIQEEYNQAKASGADMQIKLADWTQKIIGTEHWAGLQNDIKFNPEGLSVNEAKVEQERVVEQDKAAVESAVATEESIKIIRDNVTTQLMATGVKQKDARIQAHLYGEAFRSFSEKSGISADALFERYGLKIQAATEIAIPDDIETVAGQKAFNQVIDASDRFKIKADEAAKETEKTQLPHEKFAARFGDDKKMLAEIEKAQDPKLGPYVSSKAIREIGWVPNSSSAPTGTIGDARIMQPYEENGKKSSDPLMWADDKYNVTKDLIKKHGEDGTPLTINTSSDLIGKDDYIAAIPRGTTVNMYMLTNDKELNRILFPGNASKLRQENAVKKLRDAGITVNEVQPTRESVMEAVGENNKHIKSMIEDLGEAKFEEKLQKSLVADQSSYHIEHSAETDLWHVSSDFAAGDESFFSDGMSEDAAKRLLKQKQNEAADQRRSAFTVLKQDVKGQIRFGKDRQFNIDLFKSKDQSTFLHETGHFLLEVMGDLAADPNVSQQLKDDHESVLKWLGVESRDQIATEHHEQFARGFEAYLMEGKAPSSALRKAFNTFKTWLTRVYQSAKSLNVEMNPEITAVFDRLLVADSQTTAAEKSMAYDPLFFDPKAIGFTDAKAEAYIEAREQARLYSESVIREKLMKDITQKQTAEYKARKSDVTKEITDDANALLVYKTIDMLKTGKNSDGTDLAPGQTQVTLSRASVESVFGKEFIKDLPKGIFQENGMHFDIAAQMMGYKEGIDMIREMAASPPKADYITQNVEKEMMSRYPELLTSPDLPEAAVQAVHNDQRAKMLRIEAEFLQNYNPSVQREAIRKVARRMPSDAEVKAQAKQIISMKNVGDLYGSRSLESGTKAGLSQIYQRAEVKNAKLAGELLAKGDYDGAFEAKKNELLNHELYRAAVEAKYDVEKNIKNWKRFFRADEDIAKSRDVDIVNAARAVLAQFNVMESDKAPDDYLQGLKQYDADTYHGVKALVDMATHESADYKTINYEKFQDMSDAVNALWDLSKASREIVIEGVTHQRDELLQQGLERVAELTGDKEKIGYKKAVTDEEKRGLLVLNAKAMYRKVEHWAYEFDRGNLNGWATKYIVRPIIDGQTKYNLAKVDLHKELATLVPLLDKDQTQAISATAEIGYTFKNKLELLHAIAHSGNDSNLRKLLLGRGWGVQNEDQSLDRTNWDKMIKRMQEDGTLTKKDYDMVQSLWDMNEKLKGGAQKAHKKMYGYYFSEITANPIETAFGTYRGGYIPAIVDPNMSQDAKNRGDKEALESFNNTYQFPTTGNGFTKGRVEYNAPLQLDLNKIVQHMEKVLRFTHIEPAVKDVAKLVLDKQFSEAMAVVDPHVVSDMLVPWLQRSATQAVVGQGLTASGDAAARFMRKNASLQMMAFNVANWFQNTTGLFNVITRVDSKHVAGAIKERAMNPLTSSAVIQEKSEYMRTRIGETTREISAQYNEIVLQQTKLDKIKDASTAFAFFGESISNGIVEQIAWMSAYRQAITQGNSETESVKFADATTRQTLGDMTPAGSSRIEGGTPFTRLFTMFSGFFFNSGNLALTEAAIAKEMGLRTKEGGKRAATAYIMIVAAPAITSAIIMRAFAGEGLDADDDGEYVDDIVDMLIGSQVKFLSAMIPGGTIANTFINMYNDKPYDDKINTSPVASAAEAVLRAPKTVYEAVVNDGSKSKAIRDAMMAVGMSTSLPASMIARPMAYLADVSDGRANPTGPVDFARGVLTGKKGSD